MKISVIGLGYIGLPTSLLLASGGSQVIGFDVNKKIINALKEGKLHFEEPGLYELFKSVKKNFDVSEKLSSSDVYIIAVPTPLNENIKIADVNFVKAAAESISEVIKPGQLVILESTVPPGTSENIVIPIIRKKCTGDFYYSHCPERAIPGKTLHEMVNNDRIVGAIDEKSHDLTDKVYKLFVNGKIYKTNVKTAEFVKLMENTSRDINIALANEFSLLAEEFGINVWEAIKLANLHPRVDILNPGPGVGGHCLAIDPFFLAGKSNASRIVKLARDINDNMPFHVVKLVKSIVGNINNPTITVLGLAYKANVDDLRESPAKKIVQIAESEGLNVKVYDPLVKNYKGNCKDLFEASKDSDCIVLVTDHDEFKKINPNSLPVRSKNLVDTRNFLDFEIWKNAGFIVKLLGSSKS